MFAKQALDEIEQWRSQATSPEHRVRWIGRFRKLVALSGRCGQLQRIKLYHRYIYNVTRSQAELTTMIRRKVGWLRRANILFALGTMLLAALLIV